MDLKKVFGLRIKELRNKKKLTQFKLAEALWIDEKHLSHIETGRSFPKSDLIEKLAKELDVDLNTLFDFPNNFSREDIIKKIVDNLYKTTDFELQKIYKIISIYLK